MSSLPDTPLNDGTSPLVHMENIDAIMREEDNERLLPPVLLQYWHMILRWRIVLLGIIGTCLVIGLVTTMLMAPLYTARSEIEVSRQQKRVTNVASLDADPGSQDFEFYATQYSLLKAVSLAQRVARNLNLVNQPDFFTAHGQTIPKTPDVRARLATALLLKNIAINPIRTSRLIDISYTSRSRALSAQIANAWVHEFINATMDREYESTAQARSFLEARLDALRAKLEQSEQNAVNYASSNNIVALQTSTADGKTETQKTLTSADLDQLDQALMAARADRIAAENRAHTGRADISADALNNPAIGQLREKRAEVSSEYAKLLTQFEPGFPAAKALKQQLDDLDASLARDYARVGAERSLLYRETLAREQDLQAQVDAAKAQLDRQNYATIRYNIFQRDADTNRQLYDGLLQRYKEIAEAGNVGASNIAIVDRAEVPTVPSSPKLFINLVLSLLAGIGLGAAAVLALDQIDEGIRSPADVWNLLKLPLLGNVPLIEGDLTEALVDPSSLLSEAYLSIRSNLAFATNHGLPHSLTVTSSQPGEGKSTSALALAQIIGRTGKSVVLVDADLRSPSVHRLTDLKNVSGFSNLLAGDEEVFAHIHKTEKQGFWVMTAGPLPPNPAELLSSDRLAQIAARLLERFDHVIIDAPPVLELADAPLICRSVEGCVMVTEFGRSPLRRIRASLQRLRFTGVKIFGVVVTKIDFNRQHYGYDYKYTYNYASNKESA